MSTRYENINNQELILTRFWGGKVNGVCLQLTKPNNFTADPVQLTLKECIQLKQDLRKVKLSSDTYYKIQDEVYLDSIQLQHLIKDLDLFIFDKIHNEN